MQEYRQFDFHERRGKGADYILPGDDEDRGKFQGMTEEVAWQLMVATGLSSFLDASSMIIGGLIGWFAGAGKNSYIVGLVAIFGLPLVLYLILAYALSPYGLLALDHATQLTMQKLAIASYVGTVAVMLIMFVLLAKARKSWRETRLLLEAAT